MYACNIHCTDNELFNMFIYYTNCMRNDHDQLLSLCYRLFSNILDITLMIVHVSFSALTSTKSHGAY